MNYGKQIVHGVRILLATIIIISLSSYHNDDPSFSVATNKKVDNILGLFGSHISDIFIQFFGYFAFLIPIIFAINSVLFFLKKNFAIKQKFLFISLFFLSGLLDLFFEQKFGIFGFIVNIYLPKVASTPIHSLLFLLFFLIFIRINLYEIKNKNKKMRKKVAKNDGFFIKNTLVYIANIFINIKNGVKNFFRRKYSIDGCLDDHLSLSNQLIEPNLPFLQKNDLEKNSKKDNAITQKEIAQESKIKKSVVYNPGSRHENYYNNKNRVETERIKQSNNDIDDKKSKNHTIVNHSSNSLPKIFANERNQRLYEELHAKRMMNSANDDTKKNNNSIKISIANQYQSKPRINNEECDFEEQSENQVFEKNECYDDLMQNLKNNYEKLQNNNKIETQASEKSVFFQKKEFLDNEKEDFEDEDDFEDEEIENDDVEGDGIDEDDNDEYIAKTTLKKEEQKTINSNLINQSEEIKAFNTVIINENLINAEVPKINFEKNANLEKKISLFMEKKEEPKNSILNLPKKEYPKFQLPSIHFLSENKNQKVVIDHHQAQINAEQLLKVLEDFSVYGRVLHYHIGPVITLYEFEPLPGTKSSRVIGLCDDIARSLSATSARISVISGKNAIGIELPNEKREIVLLKEILSSDAYNSNEFQLPIALGKNISGEPIVVDLAKMPHLLVAGTTGSGKSVAINVMILSILYSRKPDECRFIMIDPKMLELSVYNGIPHLLTPVVTDPKKAVVALKWVVKEMENRYRMMSYLGVRNISGYNEKIEEAFAEDEDLEKIINIGFDKKTGEAITEKITIEKKKFPYIVVIVDEMADLMLVSGKEIEFYIQRLAQMARAAGIHIIMATQRPSVDVITGVIKANLPTRISFAVTSKIDSRTILGEQGAEQLLGLGDMLYMASGNKVSRIHGPFVSDSEVERIVQYLHSFGPPNYLDEIANQINLVTDSESEEKAEEVDEENDDALFQQAVEIIKKDKRVSISYIQRQLRIGYNKAASLVERMEVEGIVTAPNHQGKRVLVE